MHQWRPLPVIPSVYPLYHDCYNNTNDYYHSYLWILLWLLLLLLILLLLLLYVYCCLCGCVYLCLCLFVRGHLKSAHGEKQECGEGCAARVQSRVGDIRGRLSRIRGAAFQRTKIPEPWLIQSSSDALEKLNVHESETFSPDWTLETVGCISTSNDLHDSLEWLPMTWCTTFVRFGSFKAGIDTWIWSSARLAKSDVLSGAHHSANASEASRKPQTPRA